MSLRHAWLVGLLLVAGCGTDDPDLEELPDAQPALEECVEAVADAAEASEADLWPAFGSCASVEDFATAVAETGAELPDSMEPEAYVVDRCAEAGEIEAPDLCDSL